MYCFVARTQRQVIGIAQYHVGTRSRYLINGDTLDRTLGTDWHEARSLYRSMGSQKNTATRRGGRVAVFEC